MQNALCGIDLSEQGGAVSLDIRDNLLIVACLDATVTLYNIGVQANGKVGLKQLWRRQHKAAARKVRLSSDGARVYSVTANRGLTVFDTKTSAKIRCIRECHEVPAYSLCHVDEGDRVAAGHEDGTVRVWDLQSDRPLVRSYEGFQDEDVTDVAVAANDSNVILATSQDATLVAYDMRKRKPYMTSEMMHSDLHSICVGLGDNRTYVGGGDGHIEVFGDDNWGNITSRIQAAKSDHTSIECLRKIGTCQMVYSSSLMSNITAVELTHSNKFVKWSAHGEGVEEMCCNDEYLITCGHDDKLKIWSLSIIAHSLDRSTANNITAIKETKKRPVSEDFFDDL